MSARRRTARESPKMEGCVGCLIVVMALAAAYIGRFEDLERDEDGPLEIAKRHGRLFSWSVQRSTSRVNNNSHDRERLLRKVGLGPDPQTKEAHLRGGNEEPDPGRPKFPHYAGSTKIELSTTPAIPFSWSQAVVGSSRPSAPEGKAVGKEEEEEDTGALGQTSLRGR